MNLEEAPESLQGKQLEQADKWILTQCMQAVKDMTDHFEHSEHGLAAQRIYDFAWSDFCDWYIELAKSDLFGEDEQRKAAVRAVLQYVLSALLKMLHPFMPFLTETVYRFLPGQGEESCMLSQWPVFDEAYVFEKEAAQMEGVMEVIRAVRNLRAELKVQAGLKARLLLRPQEGWQEVLEAAVPYFTRLANASEVTLLKADDAVNEKIVSGVVPAGEVLIPLGDLVDIQAEIKRLNKELDNLEKEIARGEGKLNNQGFLSKAPEHLVQTEKDKLEQNKAMFISLQQRIQELQA